MSHSVLYRYAEPRHCCRAGLPASRSAAAVSRHLNRATGDYTLVHGGRQVRIGPVRSGSSVGTAGDHGPLVDRDRNIFCLSRRRAHPAGRPAGGNAVRLRRPHRRIACAGRPHHQPATARSGAVRAEAQRARCSAKPVLEQRAAVLSNDGLTTGSIRPTRNSLPAEAPERAKPSPISDTVIFSAPPDREARLQSRALPRGTARLASAGAGLARYAGAGFARPSTRSSSGRPRR